MRTQFLFHILLTFVWVALTGVFSGTNFFFGFVTNYIILWVISTQHGQSRYFTLTFKIFGFLGFFLYELLKANLQVAYDVITPTFYMKPGIVKVPLDAKTDLEITLLANVISLTPGTLSLDVSSDRKWLYVHGMFVTDKEKFVRDIKEGFEKRLLAIMR